MKICSIPNCGDEVQSKGYCSKHYKRFWRHGDSLYTKTEMHGLSEIPEYDVWKQMKQRCYNKNHNSYENYDGRGIKVCDRWLNSFLAFYIDMGRKLFPKATIDRIDNDKGYFPGNCRWTTYAQNNRNTSRTKLTMEIAKEIRRIYKDDGMTRRKLARKYDVCHGTINCIIHNKIWREI